MKKLYFIPDACSLAIHIGLKEVRCEFKLDLVNYETKLTSQGVDYYKINSNGYVPSVEIESGEILTEVPAILQYLADLHCEQSLVPKNGTIERTRLQSLLNFTASELHKGFAPFWYVKNLSSEERIKAKTKLYRRFQYIEDLLSDGRYYLMEQGYSIADIYAFVVIRWVKFHDISLNEFPYIVNFLNTMESRECVKEALIAEEIYK